MSAVQAYQGQGSRRHPASRESRSCMPTDSSTSTSPGTPLPPSPSRTSRPRVSSPQYRLPDPGADRELARTARLPGARAHGHAGRQRRHPPRTRDASSRPAGRSCATAGRISSPQESSASSGEPPASSAASPRSTTAASSTCATSSGVPVFGRTSAGFALRSRPTPTATPCNTEAPRRRHPACTPDEFALATAS